jgi:hypothetical protein
MGILLYLYGMDVLFSVRTAVDPLSFSLRRHVSLLDVVVRLR